MRKLPNPPPREDQVKPAPPPMPPRAKRTQWCPGCRSGCKHPPRRNTEEATP